jgi:FkbM family methyltransferase
VIRLAHALRAGELSGLMVMSRLFGLLPPGLGQATVARTLQGHYQGGEPVLRTQRMATGERVRLDLSDRQQFTAYVTRRYQDDLVALIVSLLPRSGVFVDVGANIGLISFAIAACRPDVSIFAFEPDEDNAVKWLHNANLNRGSARLEQVALGAAPGVAEIVTGSESGHSHIPVGGEHGSPVSVTTLDAYVDSADLTKIDVLKVDVEGYEPFVFQGARRLLEQGRVRAIICEMNDAHLKRVGFSRSRLMSLLGNYGLTPHLIPPTGARKLRRAQDIEHAGDLLFTKSRS